jgi:hypothetical protein
MKLMVTLTCRELHGASIWSGTNCKDQGEIATTVIWV